jgi:hypothetical protein
VLGTEPRALVPTPEPRPQSFYSEFSFSDKVSLTLPLPWVGLNPPVPTSQVVGITDVHHHAQSGFIFFYMNIQFQLGFFLQNVIISPPLLRPKGMESFLVPFLPLIPHV